MPTKNPPLISLCVITGNCAEYAERFFNSFAPVADEIVLVRAIGAQTADETEAIARRVAAERGIPFVFEDYFNAPSAYDWPHVDSFAAARQKSFDLASGEYCFWADTDDVLEPGSAEIARELAGRGGYPVFMFPYNIHGRGVVVMRERMIAKSAGAWRYPVHECFCFKVEPAQGVEDARVVVTHLPKFSKSGSKERNLRILRSIPETEMTTGLMFHLFGELMLAGDMPGAIETAKRALARPDIGKAEKYDIFIAFAQTSEVPAHKFTFLHQAYAADPTRREALGNLICVCMDYGMNREALAYARQFAATEQPLKREWNERSAIYGWAGHDIFSQALRVNGRYEDAEKVRQAALAEAGGPRISLLHATRGRPQQAALARKIWLDLAERPDRIEHIIVMDEDDDESVALRRFHSLVIPAGGGCVAAWNHALAASRADVLVQLSDDWIPPPFWDRDILARIGDVSKPAVLAVSDGHRTDDLLCMVICTRAYLQEDGFLFHPDFTGVFSDNYFTEQAYRRGAVIQARDLVFTHNHPAFGAGKMDATYEAQNAPARYEHGQAVLARLNSGVDWSSVPGFMDFHPFYDQIAERMKDGDTAVEIGVWMGRSIIYLAQRLKKLGKLGVRLVAVDTFAGELGQPAHTAIVAAHGGSLRAVFEANLKRCGVREMVEIVQGDSAASASAVDDGSVAFCYVDAAHDYESVKRDLAAWRPKIAQGGIIAGHDMAWHEVKRAVKEAFPAALDLGNVWAVVPEAAK